MQERVSESYCIDLTGWSSFRSTSILYRYNGISCCNMVLWMFSHTMERGSVNQARSVVSSVPSCFSGSRDSVVGIATGYGLDGREVSEFESQWGQEFSLLHVVQTGSGAHPASYRMGTGRSLAGSWSRPLTSILPRSRKCGSIHPLPHTPWWRST
jgi:hypothetical protein